MKSTILCHNTSKWLIDTTNKYDMSIKNCKNINMTEFEKEDNMEFFKNNIIPFVSMGNNHCVCFKCKQLMGIYSKILSDYNNTMLNHIMKYLSLTTEVQDNLTYFKKALRYKDRCPEKYEEKKADLINTITDLLKSKKSTISDNYLKILEDGTLKLSLNCEIYGK